ncbi:hypothetical protein Cgig2_025802 [Carnegiea gigantea]|uniref:Ubiquitin-like protease family profile domain-containing protein n=1 Tax=Carnegiea gigantea TaxID=171969 RepID=A0A9Q1KDR0_9CARY|nr:hypothetical protein Cgig2_025802 [Carnegiea gigantea]
MKQGQESPNEKGNFPVLPGLSQQSSSFGATMQDPEESGQALGHPSVSGRLATRFFKILEPFIGGWQLTFILFITRATQKAWILDEHQNWIIKTSSMEKVISYQLLLYREGIGLGGENFAPFLMNLPFYGSRESIAYKDPSGGLLPQSTIVETGYCLPFYFDLRIAGRRKLKYHEEEVFASQNWEEHLYVKVAIGLALMKLVKFTDVLRWEMEHADCPQQDNGHDCGVYMLMFMDLLSIRVDGLYFDQPYVRQACDKLLLSLLQRSVAHFPQAFLQGT